MIEITIRSYLVADDEDIEDETLLFSEKVDELQTSVPQEAIDFYKRYVGTHRILMKVWDDDEKVNNPDTNRNIADAILRAGNQ